MPSGYILRNMLMYAKLVWTEVLKPTQRHSDRIKGINISTKSIIISGVLFIATSILIAICHYFRFRLLWMYIGI